MRDAIAIATETGQGREVALLHNNLGELLLVFEGPVASLDGLRAGVTLAEGRGLAADVAFTGANTLQKLFDSGELDEAFENAVALAGRLEDVDVLALVAVRAGQARILAVRGQVAQVADLLDWIESTSRGARAPEYAVMGLASSALVRAGLGQNEATGELLAEIESTSGARGTMYYAAFLPEMVRTSLGIGDRELAERLVDGFEPRYPYAEHALVGANAALAEARGDLKAASESYAEAADRWERFGVLPEHAFALLGQGRCLVRLARPTEAASALRGAREVFERLRAAPALADTDSLLQEATAISS